MGLVASACFPLIFCLVHQPTNAIDLDQRMNGVDVWEEGCNGMRWDVVMFTPENILRVLLPRTHPSVLFARVWSHSCHKVTFTYGAIRNTHMHAYIHTVQTPQTYHTYVHTYIHTYIHTYVCVYVCTYVRRYTWTHMIVWLMQCKWHGRDCADATITRLILRILYIHTHMHTHAYMPTYTYTNTIHAYVYVHKHNTCIRMRLFIQQSKPDACAFGLRSSICSRAERIIHLAMPHISS
jgi:hypothetical protein